MKKAKAILAGLAVAGTLMLGVTFTGASVSNNSAVAIDIHKPQHGVVAKLFEDMGSLVGSSSGQNVAQQNPLPNN
jgi:hypothetical protein